MVIRDLKYADFFHQMLLFQSVENVVAAVTRAVRVERWCAVHKKRTDSVGPPKHPHSPPDRILSRLGERGELELREGSCMAQTSERNKRERILHS